MQDNNGVAWVAQKTKAQDVQIDHDRLELSIKEESSIHTSVARPVDIQSSEKELAVSLIH